MAIPFKAERKRPMMELLLRRHLFMQAVSEINSNVFVYKTDRGPIFCIAGSHDVIKKYRSKGGGSLILFDCSHDLREELDNRIYGFLSDLGFSSHEIWIEKIIKFVDWAESMSTANTRKDS